jgi:hypothetical protein
MTFNLTLPTRSSDKEVVKEGVYTAINQLIGTSSDKAARKITRELSDKAEETALTIEEIACKYYPIENYLICKISSSEGSCILGQFEVSCYNESAAPAESGAAAQSDAAAESSGAESPIVDLPTITEPPAPLAVPCLTDIFNKALNLGVRNPLITLFGFIS